MDKKSGKVSVTTENIFPVIRQWLYEDKDIFVRELVSNCADAISKHRRLQELGKAEEGAGTTDYSIRVVYDDDAKTIAFEDDGVGMTEEEVEKYINQIAFSGALDFVTKYQQESTDKSGIIGHFGLGFYSAFMVADEVTINTKSFISGSEAVCWKSSDGMDYEITASDRSERGTSITLKLSDEAAKQFDSATVRMTLRKYCYFAPANIYYVDVKADKLHEEAEEKRRKEAEEKNEEFSPDPVSYVPVNDKTPLWTKKPSECSDDEYRQFYHSVFNDGQDPLFWIHLNMDYPFTLQGILYFPKTDNVYQNLDGRIKIYNHQIFVADNIEEIIPEFLFLLRGCLDCSDLPLNVSRSALQQDEYVKKLSSHIIKKVSDKLCELFRKQREDYEKYWSDISVFVKYGMLKEEKFYEKVEDVCLYKTVDGKFKTFDELISGDHKTVRYTTDCKAQAAYIDMSKSEGYDVVVMDSEIDNNFMSFHEYKKPDNRFARVDSEIAGEDSDEQTQDKLKDFFRAALSNEKMPVFAKAMGKDKMPALIREAETNRRMKDMRAQYERMMAMSNMSPEQMDEMFPETEELVVNTDSPLIVKLQALESLGSSKEACDRLAQHIYDQAKLAHGSLDSDGLERFLKYNSELLAKSAENL
ncbi:MAG: molecular chaperone HtpG [Saccharofermentans sp.]|jgi:molecular chaperone HtpG|nr:molecular chaperone HtpG [Mageeibacillus sp.]MCI1264033.1 molecular chaperone HtpG [Saccharofermentans sp.]MCI1275451.1 molecular chaperone HtpG [Saccharofermentans sp.]MCI1769616.1 molecular chaperone HtpG [Mageeibacillus sp.]MCI2044041.1 molecular chaperone HtpG [Mageeibacillus sp.]